MENLDERVREAIRHFWTTRDRQANNQGAKTGQRDAGTRTAVTGGAQLDGFVDLVGGVLSDAGLPDAAIIKKQNVMLPGFFRPTKEWDLLVVVDGELLAALEFKSQVGSFGNNYNNRTEESLGNAVDLLTAYREGAFKPSKRPWLGYMFLLEDSPGSNKPVSVKEPWFPVFEEFKGASYAQRYCLLCLKLVRERLYDATCFLMSPREAAATGEYREPEKELSFRSFITSLAGRAEAYAEYRKG